MLSVVPGTERALRHSSYVIVSHVNTDIGFLPKKGDATDEGEASVMILELQPSWTTALLQSMARAGHPAFPQAKSNIHGNHISPVQGLLFPAR